ncbi:uncharacterized protein [Amphiura filiformis]|uniref:uncharacterized protein n=1 Tax=Amphiura filiformis TaxID=82378 RepID=UPI003B210101
MIVSSILHLISFAIVITVISINNTIQNGLVTSAQLLVRPLWDVAVNDTNSCFAYVSDNVTLFRGSPGQSCSLQVTVSQGSHIQLQINEPVADSLDQPFLYVERTGDLGNCPNKYVVFYDLSKQCSTIITDRNVTIIVQGVVNLAISNSPSATDASPQCPEFNQNMINVQVNQTFLCKNVQSYGKRLLCECEYVRTDDVEWCRVNFQATCGTILGPRELIHQCNDDMSQNNKILIIYPIDVALSMHLDLSRNTLVEIKARSFQEFRSIQLLHLESNQISKLNEACFEGLSNLTVLDLRYNMLSTLPEGIFKNLNNLNNLDLESNQINNLPEGIFHNMTNLHTLDLEYNQMRNLSEGIFQNLTNLDTLDLGYNQMSTLPEGIFHDLTNLETLDLGSNQLSTLSEGIFDDLNNLYRLDLSINQIGTLPEGIFKDLTNLETLNLYYNQLSTLPEGIFKDLTNLETLSLSSNQISTLPEGIFKDLTNLETLSLSSNQISNLPEGIFKDLTNLETLYLGYNQISTLPEGIFKDLTTLETLYLSSNQISNLPEGIFKDLTNLETLYLGYNQISTLPEGIFKDLTNLEKLYLMFNQISTLPEGIFKDLTNLETLYLMFNQISTLPEGLFKDLNNLETLILWSNQIRNLPEGIFKDLTNLETLDLGSNQISSLPEGIFKDLTNLETLRLQSNQISTLPVGIFKDLTNLETLDLGSNQISALPKRIFKDLTNLDNLDISHNQILQLDLSIIVGLNRISRLYLFNTMMKELHVPESVYENWKNLLQFSVYFNQLSHENNTLVWNSFDRLSNLRYLEFGIDDVKLLPNILKNVTKFLTTLVLTHMNKLVRLTPGIFSALVHLRKLDISKNSLIELTAGVFDGLSHVYWLDASRNQLKTLDKDVFKDLLTLEFVYLQNNRITQLDTDIFKHASRLQDIDLSSNELKTLDKDVFQGLVRVISVFLKNNNLTQLDTDIFKHTSSLSDIDLSSNKLNTLDKDIFQGVVYLELVSLANNHLTHLDTDIFQHTFKPLSVNLTNNNIKEISSNTPLTHPCDLDLLDNPLTLITHNSFSSLARLSEVYVSQHEVCECYVPSNVTCAAKDERSPYLTCDRLLSDTALVVVMWLIGLNAFGGNLFVLVWRNKRTTTNKVNTMLLSNLAISDLMMGIYMLIIASADFYFGDRFPMLSEKWRSGVTCRIAGSLSIISSEASVFFVTLISIDRFICIRFPYSTKKITKNSVKTLTILTWIVSFALGVVPSVLAGENFKFYDNSHVCIGLPLALTKTYTTTSTKTLKIVFINSLSHIVHSEKQTTELDSLANGLYFSTAVFLGLNCVCYLLILGCYIEIVRAVRKSAKRVGLRDADMNMQIRLTMKVSAIVATDFACWFPIILLGILVQTRVITLPPSVYAWCVTFVLPINSAVNPYLYTIAEVISQYRKKRREKKDISINLKPSSSHNPLNLSQPSDNQSNLNPAGDNQSNLNPSGDDQLNLRTRTVSGSVASAESQNVINTQV